MLRTKFLGSKSDRVKLLFYNQRVKRAIFSKLHLSFIIKFSRGKSRENSKLGWVLFHFQILLTKLDINVLNRTCRHFFLFCLELISEFEVCSLKLSLLPCNDSLNLVEKKHHRFQIHLSNPDTRQTPDELFSPVHH